ncbi:gluconate 2-dehydrogenase subunit 3 family protein [Glaciecola sp. 1036]|uniref:gluconate 2-dehydrogenase subunit 3 family protein n=1 Tax=Alteromonadaceae TaxID=72275 RepID=UPI003D06482A
MTVDKDNFKQQEMSYTPSMTRRESLKWLGILAASAALPSLGACSDVVSSKDANLTAGHWPKLDLAPISAKGYGKDPNMVIPPESPWPLTLSQSQLQQVAVVADIILPGKDGNPAASKIKVPDVVNEWISAPYSAQQRDRITFLTLLAWLDDEAKMRFKKDFISCSSVQRLQIIDDIAYQHEKVSEAFAPPTSAFSRFRSFVLAAYFCSPTGIKELGYQGNVPIAGDYPGPTDEAMAHLDDVLDKLGLSEFAFTMPSTD